MGVGEEYTYISRADLELIQEMLHHRLGVALCRVCADPVHTQLPSARGELWGDLDPPPLWAPGAIPEVLPWWWGGRGW